MSKNKLVEISPTPLNKGERLSQIVSNTASHTLRMLWNVSKPAMTARHILSQEEDKATYVRSMLEEVVS